MLSIQQRNLHHANAYAQKEYYAIFTSSLQKLMIHKYCHAVWIRKGANIMPIQNLMKYYKTPKQGSIIIL